MGMGSSQVRFLAITARMNDVSRREQSLSLQKIGLANDAHKVTKKYNEALNSIVYKWSANNGADYVDLQYSTLMTPNSVNGNTPRLITDEGGRVVLDNKYAKILEESGLKWPNDRNQILAEVVGLDVEKFAKDESYNNLIKKIQNGGKLSEIRSELEAQGIDCSKMDGKESFCYGLNTINNVINSMESAKESLKKKYSITASKFAEEAKAKSGLSTTDKVDVTSENLASTLDGIFNAIQNYAAIFYDWDKTGEALTKFKSACGNVKQNLESQFGTGKDAGNYGYLTITEENKGTIDVKGLIDGIFNSCGEYYDETNKKLIGYGDDSTTKAKYIDADGTEKEEVYLDIDYNQSWYKDALSVVQDIYNQVESKREQVFDSQEDRLIAFYDKMFNAVTDNGYVIDYNVNDKDYLNQMLQNNKYYITTMVDNSLYEEAPEDGSVDVRSVTQKRKYNYKTTIASNYDNIFAMNDEKIRQEALAKYEFEKEIINKKEKRIDGLMANLDLELTSLKNMKESIKNTINSNIERTYSSQA